MTVDVFLKEHGINVSADMRAQLGHFVDLVMGHNQQLKLLSAGDNRLDIILRRHVLDSIIGLEIVDVLLRDSIEGTMNPRIVDLGSGGGFPGIVGAILRPQLEWTLVDAAGKKMGFLLKVIQECQLTNVRGLRTRIETHQASPPFSVATVRGLASVTQLLAWAGSWVATPGHLVLWKGSAVADELADAAGSVAAGNWRVTHRLPYTLGGESIPREILALSRPA